MNSEDDPEARIRELERGIANQAEASELGTGQGNTGGAYLPPPVPGYAPPGYNTQTYGAQQPYGSSQPYGAQPYGTQPYGAQQPYGTPRKISDGIPWMVFGLIAVVVLLGAAGAVVFYTRTSGVNDSGGSGRIDFPSIPSIPSVEAPSIPAVPGAPGADPNFISPAPGETVTVSGIDENKTIACNDASVAISGIRNNVNITGQCVKVSVSGISNVITVDNADVISASGVENRVTFHSGSPSIENSGSNNVVAQG